MIYVFDGIYHQIPMEANKNSKISVIGQKGVEQEW